MRTIPTYSRASSPALLGLKSCGPILAVVLLLLTAVPGSAQSKKIDGDKLLDPTRVIKIRIELPANDWAELCRQSRNPAQAFSGIATKRPYTYFKGDLWIDDYKIESVGIRKKGFLGSADFRRPSLKIKFDEFNDQDPIKNLNRLTLNNNKQDRSQVSQFLTYELFRKAGNHAPRANWAHVTVNGESLGIYTNVESIKKPFLERSFKEKSGNLYEGTLADFYPKAINNIDVKTNKTKNDLTDLKRLSTVLAREGDLDLDELGKIIDLDAFFRFWALESMTGFWDGYTANQNNFYLYFKSTGAGHGHFIPWGADWVFTNGGPFSFANRGPTGIYAQSILANRLFHTKGGPERYRETVKKLLDDVWNEGEMLAEIDRVEKLISPHLHAEQSGTARAMDEIRRFIRGRREVLQDLLSNWPPTIPAEPRKPAYTVEVGSAKGTFATTFGQTRSEEVNPGKTMVELSLDGKSMEIDQLVVRVQESQFRGFGGFGRGGPPPGGPRGPSNASGRGSQLPISLVLNGTRSGQSFVLSLTVERKSFEKVKDGPVRVTGSFQEGEGGRARGFGFGPGGGRSVVGDLRLTKAGSKAGNAVEGSFDLKIVETRGGLFAGNRNMAPPRRVPAPGAKERSARLSKALKLFRSVDANGDGTIQRAEWEKSDKTLVDADSNSDAEVSLKELLEWLKEKDDSVKN